MARNKRPITQTEFRERYERDGLGTISKGQVSKDVSAGMPLTSFEDAMAWRAATKDACKPKAKAAQPAPTSVAPKRPVPAAARRLLPSPPEDGGEGGDAVPPSRIEDLRAQMSEVGILADGDSLGFGEWRAYREAKKGLREAVALDTELKAVVLVEDVAAEVTRKMSAVAKLLDNLPSTVAKEVALRLGAPDRAPEAEQIIRREIEAQKRDMVADVGVADASADA